MTTESATHFAVLGLLRFKPMSGYDLRQVIPESIGNFWTLSYGQIYPALADLLEKGWVSRTSPAVGRRERHVYAITVTGIAALKRWLTSELMPAAPRNELMLRLFVGAALEPEALRTLVVAMRDGHAARLAAFDTHVQASVEARRGQPHYHAWRATARYGRALSAATVAWADETLADWSTSPSPTAPAPLPATD
jgi:DNA-binding PadR family transcriptional regulator